MDYKIIFDAVPSLLLLLKPDPPEFTIIDANAAYLKATHTQRHEIAGRGLFHVFPDNPHDPGSHGVSNLAFSLNTVLSEKKPHVMPVQKYDVQVTQGDKIVFEEKYWNPRNTPVLDEKGSVVYIIHQVEEVTAMMQLERKHKEESQRLVAEIEESSMLLEENRSRVNLILNTLLRYTTMDFSEKLQISTRGDELDAIAFGLNSLADELENQIQLLKFSNAELEDANHELDSFSYSVSHDLRAPLRAVNGYSQILLEDYGNKLDGDGRHAIEVITRSAARMGTLIDDLLTFSRVGKQNMTKITLNMEAIVTAVVKELTENNSHAQVDIKPLENIEGDNSMIKQVMTNLVSNALKYSSKKEQGLVEIGCYRENGNMVYYVKDNGAGFDMKYYDKLFGVFQRLHSSSDFEGTGVGLALVHRIIKKHGGEIWAESSPGEGATFYFSLPFT